MTRHVAALFTLMFACAAGAQERCPHCGGSLDPAANEADKPLFSIPITQTTVENALDHAVLDMAERYKLTDEQLAATQGMVREKLLPFVKENGPQMQKLISRFIEAQTGFEAPDPNMVADWASQVLPVLDTFKGTVGELAESMRGMMTDEQQLQLDAEMAAFGVGTNMVQNKLYGWSEGGFDPEVDWPGNPRERRRREREERHAREAAMDEARQDVLTQGGAAVNGGAGGDPSAATSGAGAAADAAGARNPVAAAKDEWAIYVARFVERYRLNEEQRLQAQRELEKKQATRDAYLNRGETVRDMERVKKLIADAKTEDEKTTAQRQLERLEEPVKLAFRQLKERLARIPTRDQRRQAVERDGQGEEVGLGDRAGGAGARVAQKKEGPGSP